jgi:integrase
MHLIFWNDRVAKDIQPQEIQAWLDGKSVGIRSKLRNEMSAVYRHGQATGLIPRSAEYNPMSLVSAPTRSDFESVDLSPTEFSAILEKIEEPMVRVLVVVVAVTGARASEVLGHRWADLDFIRGRIHIRRAWTHGKLGKPKSRLSRRPVPMVTGLAALMETWRTETMYSRHGLHLSFDQAGWKTAADGRHHGD